MNIETLIEYIKIMLIGLQEDLDGLTQEMEALDPASKDFADLDIEYNFISGQMSGMRHILDAAQGVGDPNL